MPRELYVNEARKVLVRETVTFGMIIRIYQSLIHSPLKGKNQIYVDETLLIQIVSIQYTFI